MRDHDDGFEHVASTELAELRQRLSFFEDSALVGTATILRRNGRVCMGRRLTSRGQGQWCFPGGKIDKLDKSEKHAAIRELKEETGLVVHPTDPFLRFITCTSRYFEDQDLHWTTLFFEYRLPKDVEPQNMEPDKCEGWLWVPTKRLPRPLYGSIELLVERGYFNLEG